MSFYRRIEDDLLRERVRAILRKLQMISEGKAAPIERSRSGKAESRPPAEAMDLSSEHPPPKDRSLYAYYRWMFEHADERPDPQWRYRMLCALAERDHERHVKPLPPEKVAGNLHLVSERFGTMNAAEIEKREGDRIVSEHEGVPSLEVAFFEDVKQAWVEKARRQRGRNPDNGKPVKGWHGWTEDQKYAEVQRLRHGGLSERQACSRLGITRHTLRKFWAERPKASAA